MAVVFLLYVIAEVAAVWIVGSAVGALATIGLLLAGAFLGSWLARREGGKAMRAFVDTARAGKPAHNEITDGMLIGLGGMLILLPGFVSDVFGLLLLLPTRRLVRKAWLRRIEKRAPMMHRAGPIGPMGGTPFGPRPDEGRVIVVDSEIVQDEQNPHEPKSSEPKPTQNPVIDQP